MGYLLPNPFYTCILNIYDLVGLAGWLVGWFEFYGISTFCRLFIAKILSIHIYIKYIRFSLVGFYGISTIVGYLMPNPLYTYILNI